MHQGYPATKREFPTLEGVVPASLSPGANGCAMSTFRIFTWSALWAMGIPWRPCNSTNRHSDPDPNNAEPRKPLQTSGVFVHNLPGIVSKEFWCRPLGISGIILPNGCHISGGRPCTELSGGWMPWGVWCCPVSFVEFYRLPTKLPLKCLLTARVLCSKSMNRPAFFVATRTISRLFGASVSVKTASHACRSKRFNRFTNKVVSRFFPCRGNDAPPQYNQPATSSKWIAYRGFSFH